MGKHTPTPWGAGHLSDPTHSCDCPYIFGNDDRMGCVATVAVAKDGDPTATEYPDKAEAAANQAFIVRAVNSHDDLLAACQALPLDCEFTDAADFKDNSRAFLAAIRLARAAIAKATA